MCGYGMADAEPLKWSEISGYLNAISTQAEAWEVVTLQGMSRAYIEGKHLGKKPESAAPYVDDDEEILMQQRQKVAAKFRALSGRSFGNNNGRKGRS